MTRSSDGGGTGRRFIAGAVCPACGEMDRTVVDSSGPAGEPQRRCVACGFVGASTPGSAHVPSTRHNRTPQATSDVAPTPVRLLDQTPKPDS